MPFRKKSAISTLTIVLIVIVVVAAVVAGVFLSGWFWFRPSGRIAGSGNLVTEEMKFSDFTIVEVGSGFEVEITQSSSYSVRITADDNVFDFIEASKAGETLTIGLKPGIYESSTLKAEITMPDLYELQLSGGTHGTVKGFHSSHDFVLGLSGGSHTKLEGSANDLIINADGGSHLDLSDFVVHNANVDLSGGSHATINLDGRLDADVSGGSHLYYIGEPTMGEISESGGSEVSRK